MGEDAGLAENSTPAASAKTKPSKKEAAPTDHTKALEKVQETVKKALEDNAGDEAAKAKAEKAAVEVKATKDVEEAKAEVEKAKAEKNVEVAKAEVVKAKSKPATVPCGADAAETK